MSFADAKLLNCIAAEANANRQVTANFLYMNLSSVAVQYFFYNTFKTDIDNCSSMCSTPGNSHGKFLGESRGLKLRCVVGATGPGYLFEGMATRPE